MVKAKELSLVTEAVTTDVANAAQLGLDRDDARLGSGRAGLTEYALLRFHTDVFDV